jgi:hypothetical protein
LFILVLKSYAASLSAKSTGAMEYEAIDTHSTPKDSWIRFVYVLSSSRSIKVIVFAVRFVTLQFTTKSLSPMNL